MKTKSEKFDDYELSIRCLNCLKSAGFTTMSELLDYTDSNEVEALKKFRNFGTNSVNEVKDLIAKYKAE